MPPILLVDGYDQPGRVLRDRRIEPDDLLRQVSDSGIPGQVQTYLRLTRLFPVAGEQPDRNVQRNDSFTGAAGCYLPMA